MHAMCLPCLPWVFTPLHRMRNGPFLLLQALPTQGCWPELHDGQGSGLGIASPHVVSASSATWSSGAFQSIC